MALNAGPAGECRRYSAAKYLLALFGGAGEGERSLVGIVACGASCAVSGSFMRAVNSVWLGDMAGKVDLQEAAKQMVDSLPAR